MRIQSVKELWLDELLTWYQVKDHNWTELWQSCATGYNLMPIGFFALQKIWTGMVGLSSISLRMLSVVAIVASVPVFHHTLRSLWGSRTAGLVTVTLFTHSPMVVQHLAEARPYAMMWLVAVLQWALVARYMTAAAVRPKLLFANVALSALAPMLTYTGGVYSACIATAVLCADLLAGRRRWGVWASFPAGWILWVVSGGARLFFDQMASNHGGTMTQSADFEKLRTVVSHLMLFPFLLPIVIVWMAIRLGNQTGLSVQGMAGTPSLGTFHLLTASFMVLVPPVFWVLSELHVVHVFAPRHFFPSVLGLGILTGLVLQAVSMCAGGAGSRSLVDRVVMTGYAVACGLLMLLQAERIYRYEIHTSVSRLTAEIMAHGAAGGPVITDELNLFFHALHSDAFQGGVRLLVTDESQRDFLKRYSSEVAAATIPSSKARALDLYIFASAGYGKGAGALWADELRATPGSVLLFHPADSGLVPEVFVRATAH